MAFDIFQQYVAAILVPPLPPFHAPPQFKNPDSKENREIFWRLQVTDLQ